MGWPFAVKLLQSKFTVSNGATTRVSSTLHSTPSASLTFRLHLLIAVLSRLVIEQDKRPFAAVIFRRRSVPAFVLSVGLPPWLVVTGEILLVDELAMPDDDD